MNRLSKEKLNSLIDDVIIPSEKMFISDERLDEHIKKMLLAEGLISKLALLPFNDETTQKSMLEDVDIFFKFVVKDETIFREILTNFYNLYVEWINNNYPKIKNRLEHFEKYLLEYDGFFDFDSDERDENLEYMHYKEEDKIDAKTFMEEEGIDEDLIKDLQLSLKDLRKNINFNITLTEEYLITYINTLKDIIKVYELSYVFQDLAVGLRELLSILEELNYANFDEEKSKLIKTFLDAIYLDLEKWFNEVIEKQTAKDIHYLDASLLANIAQVSLVLGNSGGGVGLDYYIK